MICIDTSLLVSFFLQESNSQRGRDWLLSQRRAVLLSDLNRLEFENALNLALFHKRIGQTEKNQIVDKWLEMGANGFFVHEKIGREVWERAERISTTYTPTLRLRSLDVIHVAFAELHRCQSFGTFDLCQRKVCEALKININPMD